MSDDWNLTPLQRVFMRQRWHAITEAYDNDDMATLDTIENSDLYRTLFADMPFDEAVDRYECAIEDGD